MLAFMVINSLLSNVFSYNEHVLLLKGKESEEEGIKGALVFAVSDVRRNFCKIC